MGDAAQKIETKQKTAKAAEPPAKEEKAVQALSPFHEMERLMDQWLELPFTRRWIPPSWREHPLLGTMLERAEWRPKVDIIDRDDEVVVRAEIPGVAKEDLDVSLTDNSVTIKGSSREERKEEKGDYYRCEITRGGFSRTLALPAPVDAGKVEATYQDGVVTLVMPKTTKAKRHRVEIK